MTEGETVEVPLDQLEIFTGQSRENFDDAELGNLAESIKKNGLLQPGVAVLDEGRNQLVLVAGERRLRACKIAGKTTMAVKVIRGKFTQAELLDMNMAENLLREDLNPVERAKGFQRLMLLGKLTASEVAGRLKVSNAMVSRDLSLLELPDELQQQVIKGTLPSSVAASLARLADDETRHYLASLHADGTLSRDGVTAEVNNRLEKPSRPKRDRLAIKLDGDVCVTVSAGVTLNASHLNQVIEAIRREIKRLQEGTASLRVG
jgi:ParB family chromosome partitioning protein